MLSRSAYLYIQLPTRCSGPYGPATVLVCVSILWQSASAASRQVIETFSAQQPCMSRESSTAHS